MTTSSQLERAQARARDAYLALEEIRTTRLTREERLRSLRNEAAEVEAEAERVALLPGGQATVTKASHEVTRLSSEIEALEADEERARQTHEEAQAEVQRVARMLVPGLAEDLERVKGEKVDALAELGRTVLGALEEVEKAVRREAEARAPFTDILHAAKASSVQKRELERFIEAPAREAGPEAEVGHLVRLLVAWYARLDRPEVREVLLRYGIQPRAGSVLGGSGGVAPIVGPDTAFRLHQGTPLSL